jgi:hypothetical protein
VREISDSDALVKQTNNSNDSSLRHLTSPKDRGGGEGAEADENDMSG